MAIPDPTQSQQPPPTASLPLLGMLGRSPAGQTATEAQLRAMREYAAALLGESQKLPDLRNPYNYSYTQGIGHVVQALMGGYQSGQADRLERERQGAQADILSRSLGGPGEAAPLPPAAGGGLGARAEADTPAPTASAAGGGGLDRYASAISKLESGGKYDELGPVTRTGDRAYGKYQVMGANVPEWTEAATGKRMTPEEFRASPEAQDATFRHRFGSYLDKYGNPQDAASAWFTGGPQATGANKRDQLGTTGQSYVSQFTNALGAQPALAFTGEPTPAAAPVPMPGGAPALPPDAQDTVRALASAGPPGAAPTTPAAQPPGPQFAQAAPPGGAAGVPPQVQVRQMAGALIRTGMDPATAIKTATEAVQAHQGFLPQFQIDKYGNQWVSTVGQAPDIHRPGPGQLITIDPGIPGVPHRRYIENIARDPATGGWRLTHTPFTPPMAAGTTAPPAATPPAPVPGPAAAPGPASVSSPVPAPTAAGPAALGTPTPVAPAGPPPSPAATRPKMPAMDASDQDWINYNKDLAAHEEYIKKNAQVQAEREPLTPAQLEAEAQKKNMELQLPAYQKRYESINKMAEDAQTERPQLQLLQRVMDNPKFYSGIFSDKVSDIDQIGKQVGLSSGQTATLLQFAKKLGSAGSLSAIRELVAQGAGAVRIPEMQMIEKSNFDSNNTVESNKAVVEIRARTALRMEEVADMARNYMRTGTIYPGAATRGPGRLTPEFDQMISDHFKKKPLFTDEELDHYNELLLAPKPAAPPALTGAPPPSTALPPGFVAVPKP